MLTLRLTDVLRSGAIGTLRAGDSVAKVFRELGEPGYRDRFYGYGDLEFTATSDAEDATISGIHIYPGRTNSVNIDCKAAVAIDHAGFAPQMPISAFVSWLVHNDLPFQYDPSRGFDTARRLGITADTTAFFDSEVRLYSILVSYVPDIKPQQA